MRVGILHYIDHGNCNSAIPIKKEARPEVERYEG